MTTFRALLLSGLVLTSVGCSGKSDSAAPADGTTGTTTDGGDVDPNSGSGTTHTVTTTLESMDFMPADLTIAVGDTVRFEMTSNHNAIEVSQDTYDQRTVERLSGGFVVEYGETAEVVFSEPGVHYYICEPHVMMDMIGTITVE